MAHTFLRIDFLSVCFVKQKRFVFELDLFARESRCLLRLIFSALD